MINSQDVHFYITRQCAQVELKNINIFSKKNPLGSSYRNGKQFIQPFVFFMLKLFRIQPCANNKSGGIYLPEPNKIGLVFF
jgi:hypothetical protein